MLFWGSLPGEGGAVPADVVREHDRGLPQDPAGAHLLLLALLVLPDHNIAVAEAHGPRREEHGEVLRQGVREERDLAALAAVLRRRPDGVQEVPAPGGLAEGLAQRTALDLENLAGQGAVRVGLQRELQLHEGPVGRRRQRRELQQREEPVPLAEGPLARVELDVRGRLIVARRGEEAHHSGRHRDTALEQPLADAVSHADVDRQWQACEAAGRCQARVWRRHERKHRRRLGLGRALVGLAPRGCGAIRRHSPDRGGSNDGSG